MHKRVILLTEAKSKKEALINVREFLNGYQDDVWDWYAIGGRWSNCLAPKYKEFSEEASKVFKNSEWVSTKECEDNQPQLQAIWEKLGMKGNNPYFNNYALDEDGDFYDVFPLKDCLDYVKSQCTDLKALAEENFKKMIEEKEKGSSMSAYYAGLYKDACYGKFSFERNVFNIENHDAEVFTDNLNADDYFAVVVDLHN